MGLKLRARLVILLLLFELIDYEVMVVRDALVTWHSSWLLARLSRCLAFVEIGWSLFIANYRELILNLIAARRTRSMLALIVRCLHLRAYCLHEQTGVINVVILDHSACLA